MSNKHIACVVVVILIICLIQGTMVMNNKMLRMQTEARDAAQRVNNSSLKLTLERRQLDELRSNSRKLIEYLKIWQPYFDAVDSPQTAELKISLRIKEENLTSLSQRYDVVGQPANRSLPYIMRAYLTFEDDYAHLINWLGSVESQLPTMRIASLKLSKGTSGNDLRMELTLEQPLLTGK